MAERLLVATLLVVLTLLAGFALTVVEGAFVLMPPRAGLMYSIALATAVAAAWWRWQKPHFRAARPERAASVRVIVMSCLCAHGLVLASHYWLPFADQPMQREMFATSWGVIAGALTAVVVAPLLEESLFQGFLLGRLRHQLNAASSVTVNAVLFALLHGDPTRAIGHLAGGFLLGTIMLCTGRLWLTVAVHGALNATAVLLVPLYSVGVPAEFGVAFPLLCLTVATLSVIELRRVLIVTPWNRTRIPGAGIARPLTWDPDPSC